MTLKHNVLNCWTVYDDEAASCEGREDTQWSHLGLELPPPPSQHHTLFFSFFYLYFHLYICVYISFHICICICVSNFVYITGNMKITTKNPSATSSSHSTPNTFYLYLYLDLYLYLYLYLYVYHKKLKKYQKMPRAATQHHIHFFSPDILLFVPNFIQFFRISFLQPLASFP